MCLIGYLQCIISYPTCAHGIIATYRPQALQFHTPLLQCCRQERGLTSKPRQSWPLEPTNWMVNRFEEDHTYWPLKTLHWIPDFESYLEHCVNSFIIVFLDQRIPCVNVSFLAIAPLRFNGQFCLLTLWHCHQSFIPLVNTQTFTI